MKNSSDKIFQFRAGNASDLSATADRADWAIVDIGFSSTKKSCGIGICSAGIWKEPQEITFGQLTAALSNLISTPESAPLNLVIEAPLSVTFNAQGNPVGRIFEKQPNSTRTRYWYVGAGSSVLIAAVYLLRSVYNCPSRSRDIRLFEGFVSFKDGITSSHAGDVNGLWQAIQDLRQLQSNSQKSFSSGEYDRTEPTLNIADILLDGIPPVIEFTLPSGPANLFSHQTTS